LAFGAVKDGKTGGETAKADQNECPITLSQQTLSCPGEVPGIHEFLASYQQVVDGRDKPGHDDDVKRQCVRLATRRTEMNAKIKALSEQARKLTPEERIELIEDLQRSLHPTDPEIDRLWAEEARDRLEAYRRGEIDAIPFEEVIASIQKR
jgi:putative addiction module component (TIGR02574 family)